MNQYNATCTLRRPEAGHFTNAGTGIAGLCRLLRKMYVGTPQMKQRIEETT